MMAEEERLEDFPQLPKPKRKKSKGGIKNAYRKYTEQDIKFAVALVKDHGYSLRKAAKLCGIPRATLYDRINIYQCRSDLVRGRAPVLSQSEERQIFDYVEQMTSMGYWFTAKEISILASELALKNGKLSEGQKLTTYWFDSFKTRWPLVDALLKAARPICKDADKNHAKYLKKKAKKLKLMPEARPNNDQIPDECSTQNNTKDGIQGCLTQQCLVQTVCADDYDAEEDGDVLNDGVERLQSVSSNLGQTARKEDGSGSSCDGREMLKSDNSNSVENDKPKTPSVAEFKQECISKYFGELHMLLIRYGLLDKPELIYCIDEFAVASVEGGYPKARTIPQFRTPGSFGRDNKHVISIIGCGNAIGTSLPPYFVFPGKQMSHDFMKGKFPGSQGCVTEDGLSNYDTFKEYLQTHFMKYAQVGLKSCDFVMVLYHGNKSKVTPGMVEWAKTQKILMFVLPPIHSLQLQPLESGCFAQFREVFHRECQLFRDLNEIQLIGKTDICKIASEAYPQAFSVRNLVTSFEDTGIFPYNPLVVLNKEIRQHRALEQRHMKALKKRKIGMKDKGVQVSEKDCKAHSSKKSVQMLPKAQSSMKASKRKGVTETEAEKACLDFSCGTIHDMETCKDVDSAVDATDEDFFLKFKRQKMTMGVIKTSDEVNGEDGQCSPHGADLDEDWTPEKMSVKSPNKPDTSEKLSQPTRKSHRKSTPSSSAINFTTTSILSSRKPASSSSSSTVLPSSQYPVNSRSSVGRRLNTATDGASIALAVASIQNYSGSLEDYATNTLTNTVNNIVRNNSSGNISLVLPEHPVDTVGDRGNASMGLDSTIGQGSGELYINTGTAVPTPSNTISISVSNTDSSDVPVEDAVHVFQ